MEKWKIIILGIALGISLGVLAITLYKHDDF